MTLSFGSLFAGIGGIDLGFEREGFVCKWQVELDSYATKVLQKHWPKVHREKDIKDCGRHNLQFVDIIAGGFPCQDISYAGRGAGLDGQRSGLFFEAVRVVQELRPRYVVLENVSALLSRGLDRVLGALAEIGYDAQWYCIPAAAVGALHVRDRLFVVAYTNSVTSIETDSTSVTKSTQRNSRLGFTGRNWSPESKFDWWETEPNVGRVVDGVSNRVDRLRGLGNAVVPQVAQVIARIIKQIEKENVNGIVVMEGNPALAAKCE